MKPVNEEVRQVGAIEDVISACIALDIRAKAVDKAAIPDRLIGV